MNTITLNARNLTREGYRSLRRHQYEDALARFNTAMKQYRSTDYPELFTDMLLGKGIALVKRPRRCLKTRDYTQAYRCFTKAWSVILKELQLRSSLSEEDRRRGTRRLAYIASQMGWWYFEQERYGDARSQFARALEYDPGDARYLYGYALASLRFGDLRTCLSSLEQALMIRPDYADALELLAHAYALMKRDPDSVACAEQARQVRETSVQPDYLGTLGASGF